jgi:hypothetical protein
MKKHGMCDHPIYLVWRGIKRRCLNPNSPHFNHYGGRGIKVCDRWLIFENFRDDMLSTWKQGLWIDRTDVNGNYEPFNCRWVTPSANHKNRRDKVQNHSDIDFVTWNRPTNKWEVKFKFKTQDEAEQFALRAKTIL